MTYGVVRNKQGHFAGTLELSEQFTEFTVDVVNHLIDRVQPAVKKGTSR